VVYGMDGDVRIRLAESGVCRGESCTKRRQVVHDGVQADTAQCGT
jgi:hypothetical protein